ncbi:hypothetical protein [Oceanobacillus jeddahense]|uniref:Uncharacterized protein n=1 Tax=Oceanobacillus jeddahense TaxID=1462527 RepID=A0ABY5JYP3_9BACI|nr:hypothetical protein [Oceanobacillus jeddahense]UUI03639.1 hypothetical protein NP439_02785 [Oceanobacillus jeddahense]
MQQYDYNPEVTLLLVNHSNKKVNVLYTANQHMYQLPKIGPRPPYFIHPVYEQYYPII